MDDLPADAQAAIAALPVLHARLLAAAQLHDKGDRDGALVALAALYDFVSSIPSFREADLVRPLCALGTGLLQLEVGNVAPLLAAKSYPNRHPMPPDRQALQLAAAFAMEEAMWWGDSKARAASRVADALHARGYRLGEAAITATTVSNWRKELNKTNGRAGAEALDVWRRLKARLQQRQQRPEPNPAQAAAEVKRVLDEISAMLADAGWGETGSITPP